MRYSITQKIKTNENTTRLSTMIIPVPDFSSQDIYIQTSSPERLDKLAQTFYGDSTKWWIIANANALGKGTIMVPKNKTLRIPPDDNMLNLINDTNNLR
jgi:hypothetical protein